MKRDKLKKELLDLWVDYLSFATGSNEDSIRQMIDNEIELYYLKGIERELNALGSNIDDMINDKEISDKFYDRFVKYYDILLELKKEYERE